MGRGVRLAVFAVLAGSVLAPVSLSSQAPPPPQVEQPTFRAGIDLVTVNVVVRDKNGQPVRDLNQSDFSITEDDRPQSITTFKVEETQNAPQIVSADGPIVLGSLGRTATTTTAVAAATSAAGDAHGRRLIVLFFDTSSMSPEEAERAVAAAREYIDKKLTPADVMAVVSLGTSLRVLQDFTSSQASLRAAVSSLSSVDNTGFEAGATTDTEVAPDTGNAFVADDAEFAIFNTDQRLDALKRLTEALASIPQKKSLIYFSSGMSQTGLDNEVQLRQVVDRAVRSNVSIYAADMRGLQAQVPGGDASTASVRGTGSFSGLAMQGQFDSMAASQDTLATLSEDTGGRAFFDSNEFGEVFDRVVADTTSYYLLGYTSTNPERDGRFRRIRVTLVRPGLKLEYRAGYYAARDFAHSGREDREMQMQEQLDSDLPVTDLPIHGSAAYFRLKENRFFVPVWLVVPGSRIPFASSSQKDTATLDILGVIRDKQLRPVGMIRDTVKLSVDTTRDVRRKTIQYQTSFELPPGQYLLKTVIRENQTGTLGSYEATLTVPRYPATGMKVSTVVFGTQLQPAARTRDRRNPLIRDGEELVPNVTHVASNPEQLYFYFEVYDPVQRGTASGSGTPFAAAPATPGARRSATDVRLLAGVTFFKGRQRVYQTPMAEVQQVSDSDRKAAIVKLGVPASALEPGLYTCQLTIVDDIGGTFAFPRIAMYLRK
jgi:VWFA-related protein